MDREDIRLRLKANIEKLYNETDSTKLKGVEVINFERRDDGSLRIPVKVSFYGACTIFHGRINDVRDIGVSLTQDELTFLKKTDSQEPEQVARTRVSQYVMHLVSQLRHVVGDGSELSCLTGALLSNPNLMDLIIHVDVDSIVAYIERILVDLACDHRSGAAVLWVTSLLSNPSLMSIVHHQGYIDEKRKE